MLTVTQKIPCCFRVVILQLNYQTAFFMATQTIFVSELFQYSKYFVSEANKVILNAARHIP